MAGVACGLVTKSTNDDIEDYKLLTDISVSANMMANDLNCLDVKRLYYRE